jgi:ribosome recycling factor
MIEDALNEARERMEGAVDALKTDLASIRTGRASPALVQGIKVEYYGTPTPLNQLATISVPEPNMLLIRPFDPSSLQAIERAILKSELGLTPSNDGRVIRLIIPRLTEERRQELARLVGRRVEEARVAVRNVRRDVLEDIRSFEKEKLISEDEMYRGKDRLQELTDEYIERVGEIGEHKEQEIMEV